MEKIIDTPPLAKLTQKMLMFSFNHGGRRKVAYPPPYSLSLGKEAVPA